MKNVNTDSSVGNAAAMFEALNDIVGIANIALSVNCVGNSNNSELWNIIDKAKAALSAPARNCDLYKNKKDAEAAFISEECKHPCGDCTVSVDYGCALVHECGVDWLFAPAAQEGGAK